MDEKIIRKFSFKYQKIDEELRTVLANGEVAQAKALMHNLKGLSANIGALQLSYLAGAIDDNLKEGCAVDMSALPVGEFTESLTQVIESIALYCEDKN